MQTSAIHSASRVGSDTSSFALHCGRGSWWTTSSTARVRAGPARWFHQTTTILQIYVVRASSIAAQNGAKIARFCGKRSPRANAKLVTPERPKHVPLICLHQGATKSLTRRRCSGGANEAGAPMKIVLVTCIARTQLRFRFAESPIAERCDESHQENGFRYGRVQAMQGAPAPGSIKIHLVTRPCRDRAGSRAALRQGLLGGEVRTSGASYIEPRQLRGSGNTLRMPSESSRPQPAIPRRGIEPEMTARQQSGRFAEQRWSTGASTGIGWAARRSFSQGDLGFSAVCASKLTPTDCPQSSV